MMAKETKIKGSVKFCRLTVFLMLTAGCTHYYYAPNMHNVPLFQQKEELHLNLSGSAGNEFSAGELQAAYAPADHFGIMVNGFLVDRKQNTEDEYGRGYLVEGGAGTFVLLDSNLIFESWLGLGYGKVENGYGNASASVLQFNRYFFQPSLGYTSDYFDFAVSLRFSGLRYNDIRLTGTLVQRDHDEIEYINRNPFSLIIEPAFTLRVGWEYLKFQGQFGYSRNITNPELKQEELNLNVGLYITISDKYSKKKR